MDTFNEDAILTDGVYDEDEAAAENETEENHRILASKKCVRRCRVITKYNPKCPGQCTFLSPKSKEKACRRKCVEARRSFDACVDDRCNKN